MADRAFADGVIRMKRGELVTLHPLSWRRPRARRLRARIVDGLRGDELRSIFDAQPEDGEGAITSSRRCLDRLSAPRGVDAGAEQIPYLPSGYAEIVHHSTRPA